MIGHSTGDMHNRMAGCGLESRMTAVYGSGVSAPDTGAYMALKGWLALIAMMENATSSEVIGVPSWNLAPLTRCRVRLRPSGAISHFSAR